VRDDDRDVKSDDYSQLPSFLDFGDFRVFDLAKSVEVTDKADAVYERRDFKKLFNLSNGDLKMKACSGAGGLKMPQIHWALKLINYRGSTDDIQNSMPVTQYERIQQKSELFEDEGNEASDIESPAREAPSYGKYYVAVDQRLSEVDLLSTLKKSRDSKFLLHLPNSI